MYLDVSRYGCFEDLQIISQVISLHWRYPDLEVFVLILGSVLIDHSDWIRHQYPHILWWVFLQGKPEFSTVTALFFLKGQGCSVCGECFLLPFPRFQNILGVDWMNGKIKSAPLRESPSPSICSEEKNFHTKSYLLLSLCLQRVFTFFLVSLRKVSYIV